MKIYKMLITLMCSALIGLTYNVFNINDFASEKIEIIKYKEMKYICGEANNSEDTYIKNQQDYRESYINTGLDEINGSIEHLNNNTESYMLCQNNYLAEETDKRTAFNFAEERILLSQLKNQVEGDSYRNKHFGTYYIFSFDYTMNKLNQLDSKIEKVAKAHNIPKSFLSAVLFREMMFMGQEDMLDGLPLMGGKTIGLCQIGIENVRDNEKVVHGKESVIANKSDDEILKMLRNPEQAVYFCAVQLKARAMQLYGKNADINKFNEKQMKQVLAGYNQFNIPINIGPIMDKDKYAEQTYKYYNLFSKYYELKQNK